MQRKETKDDITGLITKQKIYHLTKLEQAIVFILRDHEDRLQQHEEDIEELKQFKKFILQDEEIKQRFNEFNTCL